MAVPCSAHHHTPLTPNVQIVPVTSMIRTAAKPGEPLAHSVFEFFPNQTSAETESASARSTLLSVPGSHQIRLRLGDGSLVSVDLDTLRLAYTAAPP